jgi:hypothetical protein
VLDYGSPLTGITCTRADLPTSNYEISLEAQRLEGSDFFCGLTFPVQQSHCSLILGGWGGSLVGLSSIDGADAARNDTARNVIFKRNTWYRVRVRVSDRTIQVWLDDEQIIDQSLDVKKISIRPEVSLSRPLGITSFETRAAIRDVRLQEL